ncbi:hypothetical protein [Chitinophaga oryziterrae]|uniref:hypothetical protein n=1 Tax=Chitinophaga oryziterrae TaxID=1031224 RepID=UPI00196A55AC|nr:hypothetical protein [Chitinophaga oryziterrae]
MVESKPVLVTTGPGEGQNLSMVGDTYRILITGKETGGAFAIIDMLIPPNGYINYPQLELKEVGQILQP